MRRRTFLGAIGGAIALPLAAHAQQRERVRRVGILMGGLQEGDAGGELELNAFRDEMRALGWHIGGNIQFEYRWPGTDSQRGREFASSLAGSHVDVVLSRATMGTASMLRETPTL